MSPEIYPVDIDRRFGGLARLYGADGAKKIRAAHVVVVGLGGVGSWAAEALARSGVARLSLIDLDHIAESNINRQIHALDNTLGQAKVQAMRERIAHINPACDVRCVEAFVDPDNWPEIAALDGDPDVSVSIIDACDQVKAKTAMAAWAIQHHARHKASPNVNFVSVGAAGGKRHAHKVEIDDLSLTTHDPLLAQLRYRLRKEYGVARQGKIGINCVFSRESVMQPGVAAVENNAIASDGTTLGVVDSQSDGSLNCHGYGSVVSVTSTFGICAAGWLLFKIAE
ncbi:MAG: tRNA threonylcarbamoyladenosine dehydratase [Chitinophagaceae bacterium]|nr:tRNA threonylcarbamoyladenosine dehydratase [Polaromonas sp.]